MVATYNALNRGTYSYEEMEKTRDRKLVEAQVAIWEIQLMSLLITLDDCLTSPDNHIIRAMLYLKYAEWDRAVAERLLKLKMSANLRFYNDWMSVKGYSPTHLRYDESQTLEERQKNWSGILANLEGLKKILRQKKAIIQNISNDLLKTVPSENVNQIQIVLDEQKGICLFSNSEKFYDVMGARKTLVFLLFDKDTKANLKILKKLYGGSRSTTMTATTQINKLFGQKLFGKNLDKGDALIVHHSGGYMLNTEKYQITKKL